MSWIRTVPDDQWEGELEPLHGRVVDRDLGRVDHIMAVHSINPRGLAAHDGLYRSAMAGTGTLRKVERELIAYVVSLERLPLLTDPPPARSAPTPQERSAPRSDRYRLANGGDR